MRCRIIALFFSVVSIAPALVFSQPSEKVTVLWCDPLLNVRDIHSRSGVINILIKAKQAGIEAIALGVKALSGEVIFNSSIAPRLTEWEDYRVPIDFDVVNYFLEEAERRQIQIYAVFSVFSEGHIIARKGPVFNDHPDWQNIVYVVENDKPELLPITDWSYGTAAFVNPLLKEVQDYEISIIKEFLSKYSVDGIILDKIRFSGLDADFSDVTKNLFQSYLGSSKELQWWPGDVYELKFNEDTWDVVPGIYFKEWIKFRASALRDFFKRLVAEIKKTDPALPVGNFVGAWYPTYYEYGVNWASQNNLVEEAWATRDYYNTAIAEMLDYQIVGCYFPRIKIEESEKINAEWWMSVEGSAVIAVEVVDQACPVYASVLVELYKNDSDKFKQALSTAMNNSNGLYIYDLSYIEKNKYWDELSEVLKNSESQKSLQIK